MPAEQTLVLRMRMVDGGVVKAEVAGVGEEIDRTERKTRKLHETTGLLGRGFGGLKNIIRTVTGVVGLGALSLGLGEVIKHAQGFQDQLTQLGAALRANKVHMMAWSAGGNRAVSALGPLKELSENLSTRGGFVPTESLKSLTQFIRLTRDAGKAETLLVLATNIARGAHLAMAQATRVVSMAEMGRTTGLTRLGILLPKHISGMAALAVLQKRYGGATAAYNKTAAGSMANFEHAIDLVGEKLALKLTPYLTIAFHWLSRMIDMATHGRGVFHYVGEAIGWLGDRLKTLKTWIVAVVDFGEKWIKMLRDGNPYVRALSIAVGVVVVGFAVWTAATWAVAAAMSALTIAMSLVPIFALIAFIAAIVLAYEKSKTFRAVVGAVWSWMKGAATSTVTWVINAFRNVVRFFEHLPSTIKSAATGLWDGLKTGLVDVLNWIIDRFNGLPFIHGFHIGPLHVPGIPTVHHIVGPAPAAGPVSRSQAGHQPVARKAVGGPIDRSGVYTVNERGQEDIYLPEGASVSPADAHRKMADAVAEALSGMGVYMDGQPVGKLLVRQGNLSRSRQ